MSLVPQQAPHVDDPWLPYVPSTAIPWNLARVVHLHRRAGFGATWNEIERDLRDGPEASVTRVLKGQSRIDGSVKDFDAVSASLAESAASSSMADRLKAWWVFRMLFSPDPLGERLALLWHNHFATSNLKVNDLSAMRRQNDLFRQDGRAPFGELLTRIVKDPAMLDWLDASANRKEHPNENLARESMELFTIGVGNYSETDVKEAARALTGWSYKPDGFHDFPQHHDDDEKSILGRKGRWRGDDYLAILLEQPATSVRLARRLCELFMGEPVATTEKTALTPALSVSTGGTHSYGSAEVHRNGRGSKIELIASLAAGLRERHLDVGWAVERILRSQAFFDNENIRTRILTPPEFVVSAVRALEQFDPPPSTLLLAEWIARMGQDLFYPPNVFGWPGGRSWLNSRAIVARINFAAALVAGTVRYPPSPVDLMGLIERATGRAEVGPGIRFLSQVLLGIEPPASLQKPLAAAVGSASQLMTDTARRAANVLLSSAEAQIG